MPHAHKDFNKRQSHKTTAGATTASEQKPPLPDVHQRITDQIIAAIEAGAGDWKMPWHTQGGGNVIRPVNAISGKPYRGVNVLALWIAAQDNGYPTSQWATYKQWHESGAQVRKGEKSSLVVFWKVTEGNANQTEETQDDSEEGNGQEQKDNRRILARGYPVFNAAQVDGYTPPPPEAPPLPQLPPQERLEPIEAYFARLGAQIRQGGNRAFYRPATDHIQMPPFEAFPDPVDYYSTLGHESIHWTSAKHRLDRDLSARFGSEAYAAEELIAELGAAFLCADLGLSNEPRPDHAAYVASWLKVLKNDSRAIFTAAARAQKATDYLHGLQAEPEAQAKPVPVVAAPILG